MSVLRGFRSNSQEKMSLAGTLETELELKSPADKLFKRLSREIHHTPNASSDKVHAIEVQEGDWAAPGSVKLWSCTIGKDHIIHLTPLILYIPVLPPKKKLERLLNSQLLLSSTC